jgi:5'-nucleotidase
MPTILVTNDDGIQSEGIIQLYKRLQPLGNIYVVAPDSEQSAVGHALTMHRPLKPHVVEKNMYSINGTPTDCVAIGVKKLLPHKPHLIVSGINKGGNLGDDITYSGTVSAAMEGTLLGVKSIAISLMGTEPFDFTQAATFALKLSQIVLTYGIPPDTLLNVNVPNKVKIKGVRLTKQGKRVYDNAIQEMNDPWGRKHYWIGGGTPIWESEIDTDFDAIREGHISITPIHLNFTNYEALESLRNSWHFNNIT